jgi:hypothetical protein
MVVAPGNNILEEAIMRNYRQFTGAFVIAAVLACVLAMPRVASADTGGPGGPSRSTCGFLQGILYKVGSPEVVGAIFESVFGCDLEY